jgi:hypothetical protein
MSLEASNEGRALLAKMKGYIKDYAECMKAWEFIKEALHGRSIKYAFAWQPPADSTEAEDEARATQIAVTTDRGFFAFTFRNRRLEYTVSRLSDIPGMSEVRYNESDEAGMAIPVIEATVCRENLDSNTVYTVRGIEETVEFQSFLRGIRQQLLK